MVNSDLFGKPVFKNINPVTADQLYIQWSYAGGFSDIYQATNVQMQYQQQVTRRYTLSSAQNQAVIIPGRPVGTLTIGRLFVSSEQNVFTLDGWNVCQLPATIVLAFLQPGSNQDTSACVPATMQYTITGAYVTGYSFQGNADDLQVIDNITIEFLQLSQTGFTPQS